jgi:phosphatidylglycerol:prolipoprotein diacylglycerol transferase
MHPYLFQLNLPWGGTFKAASYGFMILIGFLLCLWLVQRRGRRMGMDPTAIFDATIVGLFGGIIGARIFYVLDNWSQFSGDLWQIVRLDRGGLAFFGGLVGGLLGMLLMVRKRRLPLRESLGVVASLMPLGHAFGRVGCFLNGCCYGTVTHGWTGVVFPRFVDKDGFVTGSPAYIGQFNQGLLTIADTHSLPVHPTQLYEVGYNLIFFALLSWMLPRRRRAGDTAWAYLILYGTARFVNEFFRADNPRYPAMGGLTIFQALCIAAVVFGIVMLARSLSRAPEPIPIPWEPPKDTI